MASWPSKVGSHPQNSGARATIGYHGCGVFATQALIEAAGELTQAIRIQSLLQIMPGVRFCQLMGPAIAS
jgi:hypothetical protein